MSGKIRGHLTLDVRVYPELHKAADEAGWTTKKLPKSAADMDDDVIATTLSIPTFSLKLDFCLEIWYAFAQAQANAYFF